MFDAYKSKNEVVSVLDLWSQAFSNSIYLEQDSQLRSINSLSQVQEKKGSFSISITLPQPPEECRIAPAFPQIHGKLDISPGMAAEHKRNALKRITSITPITATTVPSSV